MFEVRFDYFAGQGHGECWLARPAAAEIMRGALWYFERKRYVLHAYAIMPNHVHVLLCLFRGADLERTLHSWKSYTANEINRVVRRRGNLWEREYYDRIARDLDEYEWALNYIVENPAKAGLHDWPWVWKRE